MRGILLVAVAALVVGPSSSDAVRGLSGHGKPCPVADHPGAASSAPCVMLTLTLALRVAKGTGNGEASPGEDDGRCCIAKGREGPPCAPVNVLRTGIPRLRLGMTIGC